jgi:hypothetical protein
MHKARLASSVGGCLENTFGWDAVPCHSVIKTEHVAQTYGPLQSRMGHSVHSFFASIAKGSLLSLQNRTSGKLCWGGNATPLSAAAGYQGQSTHHGAPGEHAAVLWY